MDFSKQVFAKNIRLLRADAGMTREQLAEKAGVSVYTIHSYENAARMPTIQTVKRIADVFGMSIDRLVSSEIHAVVTA